MADSTVNPLVQKRVDNATKHMDRLAPLQQECWEFFRGNHYVYRNDDNKLIQLATTTSVRGKGKPAHRVRTTRNLFVPLVRQEVSYATQRIPSYEVVPSNTDPQTISAAKLSEKVALYLYDRVRVKQATEKVVTSALVADEGFAWPYWDSTAGPVVGEDPESGEVLHEGEVKIRTFTSGEVGWEPGVRFEDSRYWVIRQARSLTDLRSEPGVIKPEKLIADGTDRRIIGSGKPTDNTDLVIVTEYLERPNARNRRGARVTIANNREIKKPEAYPCLDEHGQVLDEPVLHKLTVIVDPDSDRDHGLVKFGLDAMRTFNDVTSKALEWKNLALNPQVVGPIGTAQQMKLTDVPGAIFEAARPDLIKWREVPAIPGELFELMDRAKSDLAFIFSQNDIPTQVEAGRAIQALLERDQNSRAAFTSNLAEFHGRLMRHMLYLVARHYTEERLLRIKGQFGWETIEGFRGADLKSQVDVRVFPSSLEPRTKASITQQVLGYADRGWISPQQAMAAINGGTAEKLIESYELDVARANRVLQRIVKDPDAVLQSGEPVDPAAPIEQLIAAQPWMPRPFDNIDIHLSVCADFMKTETYDMAEENVRTMLDLYYQGLEFLKAQKDAQAAMQQTMMAEQQGEMNAAKPQGATPMPDMPGGSLGPNALENTPEEGGGLAA